MAIVGGNLESKDIGLSIDLTGTHYNTQIDSATGYLTLEITDTDSLGSPIYADEGYWISDVINLGDKFNDFDKVFTTEKINGASSFSVQTRVSDNGYDWSNWTAIAMDGTIQSDTKQYIQIKINLYAGFVNDIFIINKSEYTENNEYVTLETYRKGDYIPLALTSNASSSEGFAFSSSQASASYSAWKAFDNSTGMFRPATAEINNYTLGFYFSKPKLISKYMIVANSGIATLPVDWIFQASNDTTTGLDGTWVDLDSQSGMIWTSTSETKEFSFNNSTRYTSYRIKTTKSGGSTNYASLGELKFFEEETTHLKLKRNYEYDMTLDTTWTEEGSLHRKKITRDEWVRIDKMNVLQKSKTILWNSIKMTSNITPSPYVVSSNDESQEPAWKAFGVAVVDGAISRWIGSIGNSPHVQINYNEKMKFNSIRFTTGGFYEQQTAEIFEIHGSNDNSTFTKIATITDNLPFANDSIAFREFTFTNDNEYSIYRVVITKAKSNGTMAGFQNLEFGSNAIDKTLILHDGEYKRYVKNSLVDNSNVSIVPIMTSDTSPAPFKITASAYNASDFPYKAFNNVLDTTNRNYWYSGSTGNNHWLKVDTGEIDKYIVNKYSINSFSTYRPTGWILEGSNNDSEWTKLDERTSQSYSDNTDAFYEFSNEIAYRYYRITVKTTNSTNTSVVTPIINKFNLFGKIALEVNSWSTVSSILPTSTQFLAEGMDSLSPLLDRRVETLEPLKMDSKSEILQGEVGKVFSKTLDLKKYMDIRKIRVEVE